LKKFPIVGIVFKMSKDTVDALNQTTNASRFNRVVFIQGFRPGVEVIGFVTSEKLLTNGRKLLSVFVPTTPIPTSGQLFLVHEDQKDVVRDADMSVEEGLKAILSGGFTFRPTEVTTPDTLEDDKAETRENDSETTQPPPS
jgi:uncharacterized membrane protein